MHGHRRRRVEAGALERHAERAPRPCNGSAGRDSGAAASLTFARAERAAVYIRTRDGDTVAIKIGSREALSAQARVDGGVSELAVTGRSSTKAAVLVHGDLNPDELAAIQDVVDQVAALADRFFAGDVQAAFAAAADLDIDGTELAKVGLRLGMREQVGYAALASGRGAAGSSEPTAEETASTAQAAPSAAPALCVLSDALDALAAQQRAPVDAVA